MSRLAMDEARALDEPLLPIITNSIVGPDGLERRPSAIVAVPPHRSSAVIPLSPAHQAALNQCYMMEFNFVTNLLRLCILVGVAVLSWCIYIIVALMKHRQTPPSLDPRNTDKPGPSAPPVKFLDGGTDALMVVLSALYAKLLVVLGIAFPVTEVLSEMVPVSYYEGFYVYLYLGSITFMMFMYVSFLKDRAILRIVRQHSTEQDYDYKKQYTGPIVRYGSFFLRLGALAFGVGSMVYSGLEFGQYFELKKDSKCRNMLQAVSPALRLLFTLIQMQFIFLSSKDLKMSRFKFAARFGLMHMVATNLCEWLYVLVAETKHEIVHLKHREEELMVKSNDVGSSSSEEDETGITVLMNGSHSAVAHALTHDIFECRRTNIMGSLVQNASPFLFPCTIEYSLICAVIVYEMWKHVKIEDGDDEQDASSQTRHNSESSKPWSSHGHTHSVHHFTLDCTSAHKGLFAGVLVLVLIIISLILFFVLKKDAEYKKTAVFEVNICEIVLYIVCTIAVLFCMLQMRGLKFQRETGHGGHGSESGLGLDNSLLVMAQTGMYIYCMFSIIACYFTSLPLGLATEICSLIQTTIQTIFILDATWRRCTTSSQVRRKPGRQIVTFLLVANMAMWTINTLEKGHADFRESHLHFFGTWAWTVITHISMPLAIFYRFHSTICLFEIWKSAYKMK